MKWRLAILACLAGIFPASAEPPASCAGKFIGNWTWTTPSTGWSNAGVINRDGTAVPICPPLMCWATMSWTCEGIKFILNGGNGNLGGAEMHLSLDGTRMVGVGGSPGTQQIAYRNGPPPQPEQPREEASCLSLIDSSIGQRCNSGDSGWIKLQNTCNKTIPSVTISLVEANGKLQRTGHTEKNVRPQQVIEAYSCHAQRNGVIPAYVVRAR